MATKLSENVLIEFVSLMNVGELALYVPMLISGIKVEKNCSDVGVTVIDPWRFQTSRALYNSSATARVVMYHGCMNQISK